MHNYTEDYFVMLEDYEMNDPLTYSMGDYGALRTPEMWDTHFSQPIRFDIVIDEDEGETYSGREPDDAIFNFPSGLILKREIMEEHFLVFNQKGTTVHNAYIVSPDNKYFEGYVFIPTPMKPKEWLDEKTSTIVMDKKNKNRIKLVREFSLDNIAIEQVKEIQRCLFRWSPQEIGSLSPHLAHKKVVDILMLYKRNIKFIPLKDYDRAMSLGGEDFPKSAI